MTQSELVALPPEDEEHLVAQVSPEWRTQFLKFIREGDASDEFLDFLDRDAPTQAAVEAAFAEQVRNFERFAEELNIPPQVITDHLKATKTTSGDVVRDIYSGLRSSVSRWRTLQPKEQTDLARKFEDSGEMTSFIESLNGLRKSLLKPATSEDK